MGVLQKKYGNPSASKTKGEQLLQRGVWYKIKGKSLNLPDTTLRIL